MIPYIVPFGAFIVLVLIRQIRGGMRRYSLADAAAWSLAAMLFMTGGAHFIGLREDLIRMVPPMFPRPDLLVTITGVLELIGAVGLIVHRTRSLAGIGLALLLIALLPANIHAARNGLTLGGKPVTPLVVRIPEQLIYIAMALSPVFSERRKSKSSGRPA